MPSDSQEPTDLRLTALLGRVVGEARQTADALVRRVLSVRDRRLRKPLLAERLHAMNDALLLATLDDLLRRARGGGADCREVVQELALEPGLIAHLPYERVQALYTLSTRHALLDVRALFLSTRTLEREESHTENDFLMLPLGTRKQAARTRDRFLLDRLLRDRSVDVIRNLLQNPRLTERDILVIATMRPTRGEILTLIAEHPRWSSRYRVRKALASNPHTPSAVALNLLSTLMLQDLRFLLGSGVMAPEVQSEAQRLLRRRLERTATRADPAEVGALAGDVDRLVASWQQGEEAPAAGVIDEVAQITLTVPTSDALIAAHQAAEEAAREAVLRSLSYPDPDTRRAYLSARGAVEIPEDRASHAELEEGVEQLLKDWLLQDPSLSTELLALAALTEIEPED